MVGLTLILRTSNLTAFRAIARDPEMFPDPENFNPLRWVEPGWPTFQEPLTKYPTIINCTQFGYGRRVCQGQTVADEDLLIGIGSIAWMFNMSKEQPDTPSPCPQVLMLGMNEKASISQEELSTGGEEPQTKPLSKFDPKNIDPTLDFSTLLIAKPLPFKFQLKPRDEDRVRLVQDQFQEGLKRGEYKESREYWGENQGRDQPLGWGKV